MSIKGMNLSWIVVSDIKKAKKFFTEKVGLKVTQDDEQLGWIELGGEEDGAILGLAQDNDESPISAGQNAIVTITVGDIVAVKALFEKRGVKMIGDILTIPGHVKMQLFEDLDGNKFQLAEILS